MSDQQPTSDKLPKPVDPPRVTTSPHGRQIVRHEERYEGLIPPPAMFAEFERILPGSANRILTIAEKQTGHRHKIETRVIWFDGGKSILGLLLAFLVIVVGIATGAYLILKDKSIEGFLTIFSPIATVAAAYMWQQTNNQQNKKDKSE